MQKILGQCLAWVPAARPRVVNEEERARKMPERKRRILPGGDR